tara:strand:- start:25122 stop:25583 length:462 start_codon:yes stop_codon:yes gene_type:complete
MLLEVAQFKYKKASPPDQLESGGLGPCIAVGAICKDMGYLAHYHSVQHGTEQLDELLQELKRDVVDATQLKIFLAGGGIDFDDNQDEREGRLNDRRVTLDKIAQEGYSVNVKKVKWARGDSTQELTLDVARGKAIYDETYAEKRDELIIDEFD